MALLDIFAELEAAVADGIIERYAVGGAVGATFYIEPAATQDVDVFVVFDQSASLLLSLTPIHDYFTTRGAVVQHEHLVIAEWPVQFLPAATALVDDALVHAVRMTVDGQAVAVQSQEHLAAIALESGHMKDNIRLSQFLASGTFERLRFDALTERVGLTVKWARFVALMEDQP